MVTDATSSEILWMMSTLIFGWSIFEIVQSQNYCLCVAVFQLDSDKLKFHSNAIVIAMHGRYYSNNASVTVKPPFRSLRAYDFAEPKNSYSVFALHRYV